MRRSKLRVVVLGAGFGGLEIAATLSEKIGDQLDLTLIDKNDFFYFGFVKLDVMFGRRPAGLVKHHYSGVNMPGVKFRREVIKAIDPVTRRVTTENGTIESDVLVIALGADYDIEATPGLSEGGFEFYSFRGAEKVRDELSTFSKGHIVVGVTGFPFKCPPAPSETALLLHEYMTLKGVRKKCRISLVIPFELPIPPSFGTSKALLKAFHDKNIEYIPENMVGAIDPVKKLAVLDDGNELPFDLFLGIPEHRVPGVVEESGLVIDEWVPVDRKNMKSKFPNVYAIGDVTSVGTPKAGLFAVSAARVAAESIISDFKGLEHKGEYNGAGSCYVEFGEGRVSRVDVDFFSGPTPTGVHLEASKAMVAEKRALEQHAIDRWLGGIS